MADLTESLEQARSAIDKDDANTLRALIESAPELLEWRDGTDGEVLLQATTSYANFPGADEETHWNRLKCAALLLEANALMDPRVGLRIMGTGAHRMMALFEKRGALPANLRVFAALGDQGRVERCFEGEVMLDAARPDAELRTAYPAASGDWPDPARDDLVIADAFLYACRLGHREVAAFLLARAVARDSDLGTRIAGFGGAEPFIELLVDTAPEGARHAIATANEGEQLSIIWQAAVALQIQQTMNEGDIDGVLALLRDEPFILGPAFVKVQEGLIATLAYSPDALPSIEAILGAGAAISTAQPPPESKAISYALDYGNSAYVPVLSKIWPIPDDLPHAAGTGNLDAVKQWFADGVVDLPQDVLDSALALAVRNEFFAVADFMLGRGADINTRWGTHEPASILHECAYAGAIEQVRYLLSKGIDTTIVDKSYGSNAQGWAEFGGHDEVAALIGANA